VEKANFVPNGPIQLSLRKTFISPKKKKKPSMLELQHLVYCFPERVELVFERNTSGKSQISRWSKAQVAPNRSIQLS
jgi:hypothetical protein